MNSHDVADFLHDLKANSESENIGTLDQEVDVTAMMNSKIILDAVLSENDEVPSKEKIVRRLREKLSEDEALAEYLNTAEESTIKGYLLIEFRHENSELQAVTYSDIF